MSKSSKSVKSSKSSKSAKSSKSSKSAKSSKSSKSSKKTIEEKYQKLEPHEHILARPDMYIGSTKKISDKMWIFNSDAKSDSDPKIILKLISYVTGFYKICDEIIVNARDRTALKLKIPCTKITIDIDRKTGRIVVWNNGDGIDVVEHKKHKILVPTMLFSDLLSGTNFDDEEERVTGGMNGLGAKLTNIYSTEFEIETLDSKRGLKFYQKFANNMYDVSEPKVQNAKDSEPYTQVSFIADFEKFGIKGITPDMFNLLKKRAYDVAMNSGVKVYFNGKIIKENTLQKYAELFFPADLDSNSDPTSDSELNIGSSSKVFDIKSSARWKVGVVFDKSNKLDHENISFVNGICTSSGGSHVEHVGSQITDRLKDIASKKLKGMAIKPSLVKENLIFFVDAVIPKPRFDSQSKEKLKTPVKEFGSEYKLTESFLKSIIKTGIIDSIIAKAEGLANAGFSKTDGKKTETVRMEKLCDADKAGTKESEKCHLFLTEGDSAKTLAMAGFNIIGRKYFGVFPLRGKLKNVAKEGGVIDADKLNKNVEVEAIKKIMGLKNGKVYETLKELRYGGIVILTDQDEDGYHIKGLLINFINKFWPSLIKYEGFIQCFPTPIVKITKGSKSKTPPLEFYSLPAFEQWKIEHENERGWSDPKYYKGLGTSTSKEAQAYFKNYEENVVTYFCSKPKPKSKSEPVSESKSKSKSKTTPIDSDFDPSLIAESSELELTFKPLFKDPTTEAISLAFDGTRANHRKIWMNAHNPTDHLDHSVKRIPYTEFFDKELRAYSITNARRAVPNLMDGFKPSQRKIYYVCVLENLYGEKKEIRVSQLSGSVSKLANYHHGETSLQGAIVKMAQNYVGSNNLNLLYPQGQFGSRLEGGEDAASARYIHTFLEDIGSKIFIPDDYAILNQQNEEGMVIEPEFYAPIIPMLLVNGTSGIGTGWSSSIEPCNPRDIVDNLNRILEGSKPKKMHPWYRHFTGQVEKIESQKYLIRAAYEVVGSDTIHITDLPVGTWTENYKSFLIKLIDEAAKQKKTDQATEKKSAKGTKGAKGKGKGKAKATKAGSKTATKPKGKAATRGKAKKDSSKSQTARVAKTNSIGKHIKSYVEQCTDIKIDITIVFHPGKLEQLLESGKLESELKLITTVKLTNMHAFNSEGKIVKYESYSNILTDYVEVRLELYQKRKDHLLGKWRKEMDMLEWKLKFVENVLDGEIIIFRNGKSKTKEQVHARLEELEFPKFSDGQAKKPSYSYTDISVYKLTKDEVEKLRQDVADKKTDIRTLEAKTPTELWKAELDEFMVAYNEWEVETDAEYEKLLNGDDNKKPKKKKSSEKRKEIEI